VQGLCGTGTVLTSKQEANSPKAVYPPKGKLELCSLSLDKKPAQIKQQKKTQAARMKCMVKKAKKDSKKIKFPNGPHTSKALCPKKKNWQSNLKGKL